MEVTAELLAFARGYADGVKGEDTLPYNQCTESGLVKIYQLGQAYGVFDYTENALPIKGPE